MPSLSCKLASSLPIMALLFLCWMPPLTFKRPWNALTSDLQPDAVWIRNPCLWPEPWCSWVALWFTNSRPETFQPFALLTLRVLVSRCTKISGKDLGKTSLLDLSSMCWPFCPVFKHADKALSVPVQLGIRPLIKHDAVLMSFVDSFSAVLGDLSNGTKQLIFRFWSGMSKTSRVLCSSGQHRIFVEPRSEDALQPNLDFAGRLGSIWTSRAHPALSEAVRPC